MKTIGVVACILALALSTGLVFAQLDDLPIVVSPNVINLEAEGIWVTVHAEIPYSEVAATTVYLEDIEVEVVKSDARGELVAKFLLDDVKEILKVGENELTLTGTTYDGDSFSGTDEILVIQRTGRR